MAERIKQGDFVTVDGRDGVWKVDRVTKGQCECSKPTYSMVMVGSNPRDKIKVPLSEVKHSQKEEFRDFSGLYI